MPKYIVNAHVTVSVYAHVEADSPEQAVEKAAQLSVGFDSYGDKPEDGFVITDADGEPENIECTGELTDD